MPTDSMAHLMIRVSYMEPGFQPEICNFRLFFLTGKFFVGTRRHDAMQRAAMQHTRRVQEGSPCHRWGSGGPPPGKFCKYKLWEGHFRVILKAPGKKMAFTEIGKKRFQPKKQGKSEGFESCDRPIVRKRPIWVKIGDVLSRVTLKFDGWP